MFSLKPRGPNQEFDPSFDRIAKEKKVLFDHFLRINTELCLKSYSLRCPAKLCLEIF